MDWDAVRECEPAWACTTPMGMTSENVASRYGVSREEQDAFAVRSHRRAAAARARGAFATEIVPVHLKGGEGSDAAAAAPSVVVSADDGIREDTSLAGLSKLRAAFVAGGTTTAGNSSQVSDGAAAVVATRRSFAASAGLRPIGVMRSYCVVGVPPDEMGVGPAHAVPAAVAAAGLRMEDIGEWGEVSLSGVRGGVQGVSPLVMGLGVCIYTVGRSPCIGSPTVVHAACRRRVRAERSVRKPGAVLRAGVGPRGGAGRRHRPR